MYPKQQEKARLKEKVHAIDALTTPDDHIDGLFLEFTHRDHQAHAKAMQHLDNTLHKRKDQTLTETEIGLALIHQSDPIREEYEVARLQLRETLNIDGLFEEMSQRPKDPSALPESAEQLQAEMESTHKELERLRDHLQHLQKEHNQIQNKKTKTARTVLEEVEKTATSIKKLEGKQLERIMRITSAEYATTSDYPPSLEKLPPEIQEDVKNILDHMRYSREAREQYEQIIDQQQTIASMTQEIETEAPTYQALQALQIEQPAPKTVKTYQQAKAYHQRLVHLLPTDVPEHIQQTEHWQRLHLTYADYERQRNRKTYARQQERAFTVLKESFFKEYIELGDPADQNLIAPQIEQQAPNETAEAYHQRLVNLLPHDIPPYIQSTEHWRLLHLTYADYAQSDPLQPDKYVEMKQKALSSLKKYLQDRDQLLTHLQLIEQRREWSKAEQDLPNIQKEIVNTLVANIDDYPLNTLSPKMQTKIRGMRDHTQSTNKARKSEEIIDLPEILAHMRREIEPTYQALQRLTEQPAAYQMAEAYHWWLVKLLPSNVPEHIRQTSQWQHLRLTYTDYLRIDQQNQQNYIQMQQEALISLKQHLEAGDRLLTDLQGIEGRRRAEQDLSNIQEEIVNLLVATIANSSLTKLSLETQTKIRSMRDHTQPINKARKPYEEITDQQQQQMLAHVMREIETEVPTHQALQRLTGKQVPDETAEAYHKRLLNLLPSEVPEHIQQTEQWQRLHLTYADYVQNDPQPQPDHYVQMKQEALSSLKQHLQDRDQLPTRLQELENGRTDNQEVLKKFQELEVEAPTYQALQRLTEQQAPYNTVEAYHWWITNILPPKVPKHIQQTEQWQQLHLTYTDYAQSDSQAQPDHYIQMKQEALSSLTNYLQDRDRLSTHLQHLEQLRAENQERLRTIQWNAQNRRADTILRHLPTHYGNHTENWSTFKRSLSAYLYAQRNSQETEKRYWDTIARKGKAIYQKRTTPTKLDQALLRAYKTHLLYRERISDREYQLLQNAAAITGLPLEQRGELGKSSDQDYRFSQIVAAIANTPIEQLRAISESSHWEYRFSKNVEVLTGLPLEQLRAISESSRWEYRFSQDVAVLTDIPQEQRRALSEISNDTTRTLLERATQMKSLLSEIREGLQTRIHTLKDEITANRTTSRIAAQLVTTMRSQKERATEHKQKEEKLHETQKNIQAAKNLYADLGQNISTIEAYINKTQKSMEKELARIVGKREKALQESRNNIQKLRKKTEKELLNALNKKTYKEFLESLAAKEKQLAYFDSRIAESEKTLRNLETSGSPEYSKYSEDLISRFQEKIDKSSLELNEEELDTIRQFSRDHDLPIDAYIQHLPEYIVSENDVEAHINNMELMYIQTLNFVKNQVEEPRLFLHALGIDRYSTTHTPSEEERAILHKTYNRIRGWIAEDPAYKLRTQEKLINLFDAISFGQYTNRRFTKVLESKKAEHDRLHDQATQKKETDAKSKAKLVEEVEKMQKDKEQIEKMREELRRNIDAYQNIYKEEEEEDFAILSKQIDNIKEEIASLHPIDTK